MINLDNLIDYLPAYFKEYDSYKDSKGVGLLEKFLNICGTYLKEHPIAELRGYLESQSIKNIDDLYINNLWTFLGEFPFLQKAFYDETTFREVFNGSNYNKAKSDAKREVEGLLDHSKSKYTARDILPYVISLYKIRGTEKFFDIIFRLFNIGDKVTIKNSYADLGSYQSYVPEIVYKNTHLNYDSSYEPHFDLEDYFDKGSQFDKEFKCNCCLTVFYIIKDIDSTTKEGKEFIKCIILLIKKFVPYYINPYFIVDGYNPTVSIKATSLVSGNTLFPGDVIIPSDLETKLGDNKPPVGYFPSDIHNSIPVKVEVTCDDPLDIINKGYYIGQIYQENSIPKNVIDTRNVHYEELINIDKPGRYYFIPVVNYNGQLTSVSGNNIAIAWVTTSQRFYLTASYNTSSEFNNPGDTLTVNLTEGTVYTSLRRAPEVSANRGLDIDKISTSNVEYDQLDNIYLGSKPEGSSLVVGSKVGNRVNLDWPGKYEFYLMEDHQIIATVEVGATTNFNYILNTPTLFLEGDNKPNGEELQGLIVRNVDLSDDEPFKPGNTTYDSLDKLMAKGVKGVYAIWYNPQSKKYAYKPHAYTIKFDAKDWSGTYLPVKVNYDTYNPVKQSDGTYKYLNDINEFGFNRKSTYDQTYVFMVPRYPKVASRVFTVRFENDAIIPSVRRYERLAINPHTPKGSDNKYPLDISNKVMLDITVVAEIHTANIVSSDINQFALYVFVTLEDVPGPFDGSVGKLSGTNAEEVYGDIRYTNITNVLKGYLVKVPFTRRSGRSCTFQRNITVDVGSLYHVHDNLEPSIIAYIVTYTTGDDGSITLTLESDPNQKDPPTLENILKVKMQDVRNYLAFSPVSEEASKWTNLAGKEEGYKSGTYGYNDGEEVIPFGSTFYINLLTKTEINGNPSHAQLQYAYDEANFYPNLNTLPLSKDESGKNVYPNGPTQLTFDLPLNQTQKIITLRGSTTNQASDVSSSTDSTIDITLKAPTHKAYISIGGSGDTSVTFNLGDPPGEYTPQSDLTFDMRIYCKCYSNRVKPPYRVFRGTTSYTTDEEGKVYIPVSLNSEDFRVFLDLGGDGEFNEELDPSFILKSPSPSIPPVS